MTETETETNVAACIAKQPFGLFYGHLTVRLLTFNRMYQVFSLTPVIRWRCQSISKPTLKPESRLLFSRKTELSPHSISISINTCALPKADSYYGILKLAIELNPVPAIIFCVRLLSKMCMHACSDEILDSAPPNS